MAQPVMFIAELFSHLHINLPSSFELSADFKGPPPADRLQECPLIEFNQFRIHRLQAGSVGSLSRAVSGTDCIQ